MTPEERTSSLREVLWPSSAGWHVYAVLDAARDPRIRAAVETCGLEHTCLYAGKLPKALADVAPYLVRLSKMAPFTETLLGDAWGSSWGIFILSTGTLEELRRHFRRFLKVQDTSGKTLIFRWYDPRVLREYLPTCNGGELRYVFGPTAMFVVEAASGDALQFHRDGESLGRNEVPVGSPG